MPLPEDDAEVGCVPSEEHLRNQSVSALVRYICDLTHIHITHIFYTTAVVMTVIHVAVVHRGVVHGRVSGRFAGRVDGVNEGTVKRVFVPSLERSFGECAR